MTDNINKDSTSSEEEMDFDLTSLLMLDDDDGGESFEMELPEIDTEERASAAVNGDDEPDESEDFETWQTWVTHNVTARHAAALILLTGSPTEAERDTWPVKTKYLELHLAAVAAAKAAGEDATEDGLGLSATQKAGIKAALIDGETINSYLAAVQRKSAAFEALSFFAEGFKRNTLAALSDAQTIEQLRTVNTQTAEDMAAAIEQFESAQA